MRRLSTLFLAAAICFAQTSSPPTEESRLLFAQVEEIMNGLSQITGWKVKKKVPADFISRDQLHSFIQKRLKEVVKPEELRVESLTLKMFGLIPQDFDLEKATIDLVTEQAAAFYDYNRKRLFITETSGTFIEQRIVLVHELAHALADQQFSLSRYIRKGGQNDDDSTAREAVMEGQATWLMWAYSSKLSGGDARPSSIILDTMRSNAAASGGSQFPVFESAPLYLRESLIFPYNQGVLFQDAVIEKLGRVGFSEVFRHAPRTTAQILHPGLYFTHAIPPKIPPPEPPDHKRYRTLAVGSVGEFDHRILLQQYISNDESVRLAPHWRAGAFRLYEHKEHKTPVLTYISEWDSEDSARQWHDHYTTILQAKKRPYTIHLDGRRVSTVEGVAPAVITAWQPAYATLAL